MHPYPGQDWGGVGLIGIIQMQVRRLQCIQEFLWQESCWAQ